MINLVLFLLGVVGLTMILVDSSIMAPIRDLLQKILPEKIYKVFQCYQCMGFWSGIIGGVILIDLHPLIVFMCGCAGSAASSFWATYLNYLEAQSFINLDDDK